MSLKIIAILLPIFITSAASFDLNCTSKTSEWWFLGSLNFCQVYSLKITFPNETITSVNGVTTPATFEGLDISSQTFHYLPKGIGKFFPKLKGLLVYQSGLKSIQAADLEGLNDLESLWIGNNEVNELPGDLLKFTPKINVLIFSGNQISRVGKDLLQDHHSFKRIDFFGNECISSSTQSDFEAIKDELRTKCAEPEATTTITSQLT